MYRYSNAEPPPLMMPCRDGSKLVFFHFPSMKKRPVPTVCLSSFNRSDPGRDAWIYSSLL